MPKLSNITPKKSRSSSKSKAKSTLEPVVPEPESDVLEPVVKAPESVERTPEPFNSSEKNNKSNVFKASKRSVVFSKIKLALRRFFRSIKKSKIIKLVLSRFNKLNKKNKLIVLLVILVILFGSGYLIFSSDGLGSSKDKPVDKKKELFSSIKKAELTGTYATDEIAFLGDMEITFYNTKEGSFRIFDRDENGERIVRKYFAAHVKVFNQSAVNNDILEIALEDEQGNQFIRDPSIEFFLDNVKDFGPDENVYHRTIREGYLLYSAPPDDAKKLNLIFYSHLTNKKAIFEIER